MRISEDDFLKNPNLALDAVKKTFLDPAQPNLLRRMRGNQIPSDSVNLNLILYVYMYV